ncbi:unnamed protein product [Kuraishia capsulata CBS 1993]|uniref:Uncharacterized protein n=1 Tax=Kuraishia capsulata CBS 1993 TaxID=1382522 RepID=W6MTI6_9ASCO|nr:uncharacterized protein KUCA_T00001042001 [Kuraishia capsulata CBS 1993]CDK25075.1 unnamed protein product [Kuraishia capsulata CBS 1993]
MVQGAKLDVFSLGGKTWAEHSSSGDTLIVAGNSGLAKIFNTRTPEDEPTVIDIPDRFSSFVVGPKDNVFVVTSNSGEAEYFSLTEPIESKGKLVRSELPLRDACFTHSGKSVLIGGDDGELILVDLESEPMTSKKFPAGDQVVSLSYNKVFELAAVTLFGGKVRIFSLTSSEPQAVASLQMYLPTHNAFYDEEKEDSRCLRCAWSPDGDYLAVPSASGELRIFDRGEYEEPSLTLTFKSDVISYDWSPNGRYIAAVSSDKLLSIYEVTSQKVVNSSALQQTITNVSWRKNGTSYDVVLGSLAGQIVKYEKVVDQTPAEVSSKRDAASLFVDDEASDDDEGNSDEEEEEEEEVRQKGSSRTSPGIDDSGYGLGDDFIIDDDNAGYVSEKRDHDDLFGEGPRKARKVSGRDPTVRSVSEHTPAYKIVPYSCGETTWNNSKRYLTMNSVGYTWSVKQDEDSTITVSFFDRGSHKEYYFKDTFGYDVASMDDNAVLLGVSGKDSKSSPKSRIFFRSHERPDESWERVINTAKGEILTSVALSSNSIVVCTSFGYIRRFTLQGLLESIEKAKPVVACVTSDRYVFTVSLSGPYQFSYSLQDLDGKFLQRDAGLPLHIPSELQEGRHILKGLFFSNDGDPCLVGQDDMLLVLSRWREPLQARWMPILDTQLGLEKMASGTNLRCWPLGLFKDQFAFIIVKGSYYPSFPLTIPSELEIKIPVHSSHEEDDEQRAEEELARSRTMGELLNDAIASEELEGEEATDRLREYSLLFDKSLLKLFATACTEQNSLKAISLAVHLRDDKALAAAGRIAERLELTALANKVNKIRESRLEFD